MGRELLGRRKARLTWEGEQTGNREQMGWSRQGGGGIVGPAWNSSGRSGNGCVHEAAVLVPVTLEMNGGVRQNHSEHLPGFCWIPESQRSLPTAKPVEPPPRGAVAVR